MAPQPILANRRASVSDAKQAYFDGDFERCLAICEEIRVGSVATASEVALLRARAYLRTARPRQAQDVVSATLASHTSIDAALTAQMLLASARIRQGDADGGIAMLHDAAARAVDAHVAIRSEIALCTALGYWSKRDIETADRYLQCVDPNTDIIHARALELQAWCWTARRDYRRAADFFERTLIRLEACQASDRMIAGTALSSLAIYAAELFDAQLERFVAAYAERVEWSSGLQVQRYLVLSHQALFEEFAGNTVGAYEFAMQARETAPTPAFAVMSWGMLSTIARNAGERSSAVVTAKQAQRLLETIDYRSLSGEERFALLSVAESCAPFDHDAATQLYTAYWGLAPLDQMVSLAGDPRLTADETFIAGVIARSAGEIDHARSCFRKAFDLFREIGYRRRAAIAAHAALMLPTDDAELRDYLATQLAGVSNFVTTALGAGGENDRLSTVHKHPIVASLPPAQREIVALICMGKSNKEIARLRNVGEQTIKNVLSKSVFRAFGVSSRSALVSRCFGQEYQGTALQSVSRSRI